MSLPIREAGRRPDHGHALPGAEMPSLQILKGPNEGSVIPLEGDRFILGRNPDCTVVIPVTSVSREHAQILRVGGKYYIEDKASRNGTFVNNQAINARTVLKNNDRIRICDFIAAFVDSASRADDLEQEDDEVEGPSTVEASLNHTSHVVLDTQPAEKLRLLIEISNNLAKILELQSLLPRIADCLFDLFRQADRCFLITAEGERLMPRVVKTRRSVDEGTARFSRSIVRKCLGEAKAFLSDDASRDERIQLSQSVVDFRIRSVMCAPLTRHDGKGFGVIQLDTQDRSKKFTQEDLKLLCGVANQASIALENARLVEEAVHQERLQRDLQLAKTVQQSFIPRVPPEVPGYEFFGFYEAAREVGGDYLGYFPLSDGRIATAVGDVAGKGISASLIMARLSSDIRSCMLTEPDPARAVALLNDSLVPFTSPMDRFVSLVAIVLDPKAHVATVVSGGHPSPLLWRPATQELIPALPRDVGGPLLGMIEGLTFDSCQIALQSGESLILFTDGVDESMNTRGDRFGVEGIERVVRASGTAGPRELGKRLADAVKQHAAGREPHDDVTLVVLGRRGKG
jgi:serine phosphatase RsbU (regulator of sigma subunit)/pSer/pThr/pTyr-binding forkhead associated (FHA) protein